ncbi:MAG: cobyrinate a,c-diamide synthase [Deltaproteobacteria bacterium]|nr:MAG: cobyrinate a,c-diamide synthase [Deltaproteobacteria bacterium]
MNADPINKNGLIIAGTNSGCGKTTVSLALMAWLTRQGYHVSPFKVGPDFIDPGHHRRITGNESRNLDGWMLDKDYNRERFAEGTKGFDISIIEGVMGLFDGFSGKDEAGSTAQMAKWLGLPIILVVNAQSMARSAAALVQGFENFDPDLTFAGVIFNKLGSVNHLHYLTEAMETSVRMPCLGGILRDEGIEIPERHLGLVTEDEHQLSGSDMDRLSNIIEDRIDTEKLFKGVSKSLKRAVKKKEKGHKVKIGVARDKAFCFYYQDNLDLLEKEGAELVYFSPVSDENLPEEIQAIYLGGGYPEMFAGPLSENRTMLADMKKASRSGMPIYAECGGFMYLCRSITDHGDHYHKMSGCFPFDTKMLKGRKALGYREITLSLDSIIGEKGLVVRGHEFHYSEIDNGTHQPEVKKAYMVSPRIGVNILQEGYQKENTLGSYIHLHFGSNPKICRHLIRSAVAYKRKGES